MGQTGADVVRRVRRRVGKPEMGGPAAFTDPAEFRRDLAELRRRLRHINVRYGGRLRVQFSPEVIEHWQTTSLLASPVAAVAT